MGEVVYGSSHARSTLGILKVLEILTCLLAVILVAVNSGWKNDLVEAFYAGTIIGIIISLLIFVLCLTEAGHSLREILKMQFIVLGIMFIYILIVSAILVARRYSNLRIAGGVFGLIASIIYLVDAITSYQSYGVRL